jgi:type I site-specific restriction endonuclease
LFLADRNILADQAFNAFSAFPEDALVRINPKEIGKKGRVPTNGNIFFTIFQTFMSGKDNKPYFGEYPPDYFDFIIKYPASAAFFYISFYAVLSKINQVRDGRIYRLIYF